MIKSTRDHSIKEAILESLNLKEFDSVAVASQWEYLTDIEQWYVWLWYQLNNSDGYVAAIIKKLCVSELKDGWCEGTEKLKEVIIMPENPYFKNYENDNQLVIGKSNIDNKEYDILIFASRKIKEVQIPPNIKIISSNSFEKSKIEKIFIPKEVIQIGQNAFYECYHLYNVEIPADSNLQTIGMNAFQSTSIERFFIPNQITQIDKSTFNDKLKIIEISNNSKLQILNKFSFSSSLIEKIFIPRSVKRICKFSFYECQKLQYIDISNDSELQIIEKRAFGKTSIRSFFIPSNVIKIDESSFESCDNLQIIEFGENSSIQPFILSKFERTLKYNQNVIFMLPQKFKNNFI